MIIASGLHWWPRCRGWAGNACRHWIGRDRRLRIREARFGSLLLQWPRRGMDLWLLARPPGGDDWIEARLEPREFAFLRRRLGRDEGFELLLEVRDAVDLGSGLGGYGLRRGRNIDRPWRRDVDRRRGWRLRGNVASPTAGVQPAADASSPAQERGCLLYTSPSPRDRS